MHSIGYIILLDRVISAEEISTINEISATKEMVVIGNSTLNEQLSFALKNSKIILLSKNENQQKALYREGEKLALRGVQQIVMFDSVEYIPYFSEDTITDINTITLTCSKVRYGIFYELRRFLFNFLIGKTLPCRCLGFMVFPQKLFIVPKCLFKSCFQTELLVKGVWGNLSIKEAKLESTSSKKVSFSWINILVFCYLFLCRILPIPTKKLFEPTSNKSINILKHPLLFLKSQLYENTTPVGLALAAFVGSYLAILPLAFVHTIVIIYFAHRLSLNKVMAVSIQNLFMPPFTPFLCIEIGYFITHGNFLKSLTFDTLVIEMPQRILEWLIGSLIIAPILSTLVALTVWIISYKINKFQKKQNHP